TTTDALRLLQVVQNAIDAAKVDLVAEMAEHGDHEAEGCSSVKNWLRDQLHLDTKDASQLTRSARTLNDMPELADLATAGAISLDHVDAFTYASRHIDPAVVEVSMDWMLDLAAKAEPKKMRQAVKKLRDATHPDDLDEAWIKGMAKHDITLSAVGEGFSVAATPLVRRLHSHRVPAVRHRHEAQDRPAVALRTHLRRGRPTRRRTPRHRPRPAPHVGPRVRAAAGQGRPTPRLHDARPGRPRRRRRHHDR
ncbi:MAG: DUF222 domain-containing protein, partial [Microbacterium sp.]